MSSAAFSPVSSPNPRDAFEAILNHSTLDDCTAHAVRQARGCVQDRIHEHLGLGLAASRIAAAGIAFFAVLLWTDDDLSLMYAILLSLIFAALFAGNVMLGFGIRALMDEVTPKALAPQLRSGAAESQPGAGATPGSKTSATIHTLRLEQQVMQASQKLREAGALPGESLIQSIDRLIEQRNQAWKSVDDDANTQAIPSTLATQPTDIQSKDDTPDALPRSKLTLVC